MSAGLILNKYQLAVGDEREAQKTTGKKKNVATATVSALYRARVHDPIDQALDPKNVGRDPTG